MQQDSMANDWVYLFGEVTGEDVKIGYSTGKTLESRLATVNREQTTNARYVVLAGLRGDSKDEKTVKRWFGHLCRDDKGTKTEYFRPAPELIEYANWLRQWWWVAIDPTTPLLELDPMPPEMWTPSETRKLPAPACDPGLLIQPHQVLTGPLAGTAWDWMVSPRASIQDYFTPVEIINAARQAMGGIDLDAASHPIANRVLRIPDFFHINRSAFDNEWAGKVWLNPPYGNNGPWFDRASHFLETGTVEQLCILSPVWAFTTAQAQPLMRRCTASVLLSPTPTFWGNSEKRTGSNHPHAIVYFGDRVGEFITAFAPFGLPFQMAWDRVEEWAPDEVAA